jgi:lipid A ethanolaminephosphotransferase
MSLPHAAREGARSRWSRLRRDGIALPLPALNLCVAIWLLALLNAPFWRALWRAVGGWDAHRAGYLLSLPVLALVWVWLLLECLTWGRAAKPVLAVILLVSAVVAYMMSVYGVVLDRTMIANIVATDPAEAAELLSFRLLGWLLVLGAVPAWLLLHVRIPGRPWHLRLLGKAVTFGILVSSGALLVAPSFQSYASLLRNHRDLRLHLVPSNYLASAHGYLKAHLTIEKRLEPVALDATRSSAGDSAESRRTLTVLVIGETARAANFGLNGYARETTPELAREADLISFTEVRSCGTSTAVSLPCMLLDAGRAGFSDGVAARRENLLDVLQRAGYAVLWRDNNGGCKGMCDRVVYEDLTRQSVPGLCAGGECYDEILLHGLQEKLDASNRDTVVVLHMKGSHGPAYYLRYPPAFEHFSPVCRTNQFERCERETIVNAYDNTLRYTDHVLARTIALLRRNANRYDASLLYVSDHGESLGERGLYLHGMPYAFAPPEQTHVPMVMWLSAGAQQRFGIDTGCLRGKRGESLSHDNLYHSMLGLLDVRTVVYRSERDVLRACRAPGEWVAVSGKTH